MAMLAVATPWTTALSINLRCATPVLPIAIGRPSSPPLRPLPNEALNVPRQQTARAEIPIAFDAPHCPTSRGFLVWALSRRDVSTGDKSAHLFLRQFLCSIREPFLRPDRTSLARVRAEAVRVGRRTNLPTGSAVARPHLDSFEHDGIAWCDRDDDRRGARLRARSIAPQPCIRWV